MEILFILLIGVVLFGMGAGYVHNRNIRKKLAKGELEEAPPIVSIDSECCGQHAVCEKESLLAAVSKQIEYYDDEELDRFKGRAPNAYTDKEIEEFRKYTQTKAYIEEVAKDKLGLVYEGEILFKEEN